MAPVPIYIVREDPVPVRIERLGEWRQETRTLVLEREGYPLLAPGEHIIEGELPWLFWEMCPSGFHGRKFARRYPELSLQPDPRLWSADECLRALTRHGSDLAGNLIIGEQSRQEFDLSNTAYVEELSTVVNVQGEIAEDAGGSSLGGDRPKIVTPGYLFKYSPPVSTELGRRWADLLRSEARCLDVLRAHGIAASFAVPLVMSERVFLRVSRFDRIASRGRRGASTLYFYAMDRLGDVSLPAPAVIRTLVHDGHLPESAWETCTRQHDFSLAIGNTDAHLANYGLIFDSRGRASLAPAFDVLPMVLAPRNDELPDSTIRQRSTPIDEAVRPLVEELARQIDADTDISSNFKALWHRYVGV